MRIIPAIDIINGKCIRLSQGDFNTQIIYNSNPLEVAKEFEQNGIQYLHLVDLDGAKSKHIINYKILYEITSKTSLKVDFGGGLKQNEDIKIAFENGAHQITAGSIAIQNPNLFIDWINTYGKDKIILGADANNRKIATEGWLQHTDKDILDFIKEYEIIGVEYVISTDIEKDGMLQGPSIELYTDIISQTNIKLVASGGVSTIEDIMKLKTIGCEGAIIGKAIYEGYITLKQLSLLC